MDMNQYLDVFIDEAKEHLQAIDVNLLEFEKDPHNLSIVNDIFRSAHTLKGMSATMGFEDLASLTHELENVLDLIRNQQLTVNSDILDVIFNGVNLLEEMVMSIVNNGDGKADVTLVVQQLSQIVKGEFKAGATSETSSKESVSANINVVQDTTEQTTRPSSSLTIALDEFERTVINQSMQAEHNVYQIKVTLVENCVLKAARAYMVFNLLEKSGEVIKSVPSVEEIEDEAFETSFELLYVSKETASFIEDIIMSVSEIETTSVQMISVEQLSEATAKETEGDKQAIEETVKAKQEAAATAVVAETEKKDTKQESATSNGSKRAGNKTIRVNIERLDALMNLFSELVIDRGRLDKIAKDLNHSDLTETVEHMSRMSSDLQDLILNIRMEPIEQVFNRFPKMIRSLAKELNKKVDLIITGADTELDRTVIDEIGDPLVHLLRNALDHGLEQANERLQLGKPEQGTIELRAYHSGNHVFIEITDDGKGIDRHKIVNRAVERGIITAKQGEDMSDQDVYQLLFASGFSTAETISDISGRGVGLDVVRNKIQSLGGEVTVDSTLGKGSQFTIQLPLTLSIISSMLVEVDSETYAIPLTSIIETAVYKKEQIRTVHGQRVIDFRGKVVPVISLKNIFEFTEETNLSNAVSIVIVRKGEKMAGLVVDSFIGQQEIVLKSLGQYLTNVFAISGATILGDGQVALILDCNALIK